MQPIRIEALEVGRTKAWIIITRKGDAVTVACVLPDGTFADLSYAGIRSSDTARARFGFEDAMYPPNPSQGERELATQESIAVCEALSYGKRWTYRPYQAVR